MFLILPLLHGISKWESVHGVMILGKHSNNQIKMSCEPISKLRFHEGQVEQHCLSSILPNAITTEISANLKYFDSRCCSIALEAKLDHNLVTRLQLTWDSRTCLQFNWIMTLKKEAPMLSLCSLNRVGTFKPLTPTSFSKQYCPFNKVKWARNIFSASKFNQYWDPYTTEGYHSWVLGWEISKPTLQWN